MTVMDRLQEHYNEALEYFPEDRIVGIFLQGSQNYGLDIAGSDVDSKLVILPTFEDIAMNGKPISTTHIRENDEHIDFKDLRLMLQTFRKQNMNFLEILFTDYKIINPLYEKEWNKLVIDREAIARYNAWQAVKAMKGVALEKFHAMEHRYPAKIAVIDQFGYDPKQLHHLLRVEDYLERYIDGVKYEECMRPLHPNFLKEVKKGKYDLEGARILGKTVMAHIEEMAEFFCDSHVNVGRPEIEDMLNEVQFNIMKLGVEEELKGDFIING